ncbi:SecDF P1 head subdomain-containing protein [Kutzneria albida]|uniref:SecDF P1 head subdomain domain-containing protein n=1 Tax=Kutzneria albida DSM 43870 TaxID=1449976 RepID=W5W1R7_9PSEU|nr:hypothetical protein [Kutzneria albida]AHH94797.1 hypothetical protein KALB_1424 [Kutzneria albida DSM 43870]
MRIGLCLGVALLACVAGCQSGTPVAVPTTTRPHSTRHVVLHMRPVLSDPQTGGPRSVPASAAPDAPSDVNAAKAIRQDPALATQPGLAAKAFAAVDCAKPDPLAGKDDPGLPLATCDTTHKYEYLLGPTFLDGKAIQSAVASRDEQADQWVITVEFTPAASATWAQYTGKHLNEQVAFTVDGQVLTAPMINGRINGATRISGNFTEQDAQDLADALNNH